MFETSEVVKWNEVAQVPKASVGEGGWREGQMTKRAVIFTYNWKLE